MLEGLADGRWALLQKTHHATIDGASGVIMRRMFTDLTPDAEYGYKSKPWTGEEPPSQAEMLQRATMHLVTNPVKGVRLGLGLLRDVANAAGIKSVERCCWSCPRWCWCVDKDGRPDARSPGVGELAGVTGTPDSVE